MRTLFARLNKLSCVLATVVAASAIGVYSAPAVGETIGKPRIWISPTEDLKHHNSDFRDFFLHPEQWHQTAGIVSRFSVSARYFLTTPPEVIKKELSVLRDRDIKLDVAVPALPVDKKVCGNGIEGTVWPGEPSSYSKKLKAMGVDVYSFSLDLPLTSGHRAKGPQSCHLSVRESAERTAHATADILAVYPNAKIVDIEVPTGVPVSEWSSTLQHWIDDYRHASGRDFDGFMMDAWWRFDWKAAARATVRVLTPHHIPVGIGINASGHDSAPANQWIAAAKKNVCALREAQIPLDFLGVANWQNMRVRGLPESDPETLTGLVIWLAHGGSC